jgi:putative ABC transport system permease protein
MAWRYLRYHWVKTLILLLSISLIIYIPVGLRALVAEGRSQLIARAQATPLLIGTKGSPLELTLNSLYFAADVPDPMRYDEVSKVAESGLAQPIPLYVRFRSQSDAIVGTTLDYLDFRGLRIAAGQTMVRLGDCVLGAEVARRRGIGPGEHVISSPENVFDLAGVYPLKLRVTGVLEFADSPDDHAIFVDVRTAWVIKGLAHGHEDLSRPEAAGRVLKRDGDLIVANASVVQYNEITDENIDSFHFHGDQDTFPITAVIAVPHDRKSATLLTGRYLSDQRHQIFIPEDVMQKLLGTVLTVQNLVIVALLIVGLATAATAALVISLSLRLRRREIETMFKVGGARLRLGAILASEIVGVLVVAVIVAIVLTSATSHFAAAAIRIWVS